jgi:hypothetical protein
MRTTLAVRATLLATVASLVLATGLLPVTSASAASPSLAAGSRSTTAGDWLSSAGGTSAGGLANPVETTLTATNVAKLGRSWTQPSYEGGSQTFIVAGGLVIDEGIGSGTAYLGITARDAVSGQVVWSRLDLGYVSLIASGTRLFVLGTGPLAGSARPVPGVYGLDLATGATAWFTPNRNLDPVYGYDGMAVGNGNVFADFADGGILALRQSDGHLMWQASGGYINGVSYGNGWLFAIAPRSLVVALNPSTGKVIWTGLGSSGPLAPPAFLNGQIVSIGNGWVSSWAQKACPAQTYCQPLWEHHFSSPLTSVTGAAGMLMVGTWGSAEVPSTVAAFRASTGVPVWQSVTSGRPLLSAAGSVTYAEDAQPSNGEVVHAWATAGCGAQTCAPVWTYAFPQIGNSSFVSPIVISHGRFYLSVDAGGMQAFALNTSVPSFQYSAAGASGTAAVSWGPGRIDLFGVDTAGRLEHRAYQKGAGWSKWYLVGGTGLSGTPAAVSWASGRLDVFIRTVTGTIQHVSWAGHFSGFETVASSVLGSPAAASWSSGRLDVFYTVGRLDGAVSARQLTFDGRWHAPTAVPGSVYAGLSAIATAPGHLDLFGMSASRQLAHASFSGGKWTSWTDVHPPGGGQGVAAISGTAVASLAPGRLDVFLIPDPGNLHVLQHLTSVRGVWKPTESIPSLLAVGPSVTSFEPGQLEVFGVGSDAAVQQHSLVSGKWSTAAP